MIDHRTIDPKELVDLVRVKMQAENLSLGALERATGVTRQTFNGYFKEGKLPKQLHTKKRIADWLNGKRADELTALDWGAEWDRLAEAPPIEPVDWKAKYDLLLDVVRDLLR